VINEANKRSWVFGLFSGLFIAMVSWAVYSGERLYFVVPFILLLAYAGWQNIRLVLFLLLFSLPFSFEYHISSSLGTDIPDEFLMVLVSFLCIGYWIIFPKMLLKETLGHPLLFLLAISLTWTAISALFSTDPIVSLKFILAKGWYAGAFVLAPLLLLKQKRPIKVAVLSLSISMLIVVIVILTRHSIYGLSFATINDAVFPFFRNHVNYSAMLVCLIPILFACFHLSKKKSWKYMIAIAIIVSLTAAFFSYARGAWLAVLIGTIAWWLVRIRGLVFLYIAAVLFGFAALFWLKNDDRYLAYAHDYKTTIFHKEFRAHIIATVNLKDVSTAERFYRWVAGVRMAGDEWLTGYGPNTFYDNYKPYAVPAFKTWVSDNKEHSTVHNYFLLIAIEQGLPGLLFFLILLGSLLYYAQSLYHRTRDIFYKTAALTIGVILTMLLTVNFLSDLIETDKIGSLFLLCLSMLVIIDINTRRSGPSKGELRDE
jgi:O-antigen ligase